MDMLEHGCTTITERWNYYGDYGMNSHNHYAFGVVSGWMFRWIGGVRVDPDAPGYRHFFIAPEIPHDVRQAGVRLDTVRGVAVSAWKRQRRGISLTVTVPPTSQATVVFPGTGDGNAAVTEDGKPLEACNGVELDSPDPRTRRLRARVGSGTYRFLFPCQRTGDR
jgi:alpha-L-rhamnosidase